MGREHAASFSWLAKLVFFKASAFGSEFPKRGREGKKEKKTQKNPKNKREGGKKEREKKGEQESSCSSKASASINAVQAESSTPSHIISQANALQRIPLPAPAAPLPAPGRARPGTERERSAGQAPEQGRDTPASSGAR